MTDQPDGIHSLELRVLLVFDTAGLNPSMAKIEVNSTGNPDYDKKFQLYFGTSMRLNFGPNPADAIGFLPEVEPRRWYHVKAVFDQATNLLDLFLDGALVLDDIAIATGPITGLSIWGFDHLGNVLFDDIRGCSVGPGKTNNPPVVVNPIPDQTLTPGGAAFTRVLNQPPVVFIDPDGDSLFYSATSSDTTVGTARILGIITETRLLSMLRVTPFASGIAKITIMAEDRRGGTAQTSFTAFVNRPPAVANYIPSQTLTVCGPPFTRDLKASPAVFNDPDGDELTFTAMSSDPGRAAVAISKNILTVAPVSEGLATIAVTADDGKGGIDSLHFNVTVARLAYPSTLRLSTSINFPSLPNASDHKAAAYRIVGLPGASDLPMNVFFSGEQDKDWQVVWDNGAVNNFFVKLDGGPDFKFSVGRAFWLIHKGPWSINTEVRTAPLDSCQVSIPLHPGWNLITNPFLSAVSWSAVMAMNDGVTEAIWKYNGTAGFSRTDTLEPYVGYYFYNSANLDSLKIPYSLLTSASSATAKMNFANWQVNIALSSGELIDKATSFGIATEASPGLDRFDLHKPRAIATTPSVAFHRPAWDASYSTFATDIRPEIGEAESWEFEIRSSRHEPSQLAFSGLTRIPFHFEAYLVDMGRAQSVNLREDSVYSFVPVAEISRFSLLVGKKETLQDKLSSVRLPNEFVLGHNYPNPFHPTTTIPLAVPFASQVTLKIYNILGEEVKAIYAGTLEAGRYWFNWDGRNESGHHVATGVYLYRLTTDKGITVTAKMILWRAVAPSLRLAN